MNLLSLILYGMINVAIVLYYLLGKGRFYQFPFWVGMISLGWFFPQAIGGYLNVSTYPPHAYSDALFFATLCSVALWIGFAGALKRTPVKRSWLAAPFSPKKLHISGAVLCVFGFFFQWKLQSLPEEVLAQTQWSGVAVKYLFFASVFKMGFIILWLIYLSQHKVFAPKLLVFIVPCLLLLLEAAVLRGRRAGMMNLVAYILISLWFVRRIALPRWIIIVGLLGGLVLINGIGTYRTIMKNKEIPLSERLSQAASADYIVSSKKRVDHSGAEFNNYLYYRQIHAATGIYDFGIVHWNRFVYNYVPAQLVGRELKKKLKLKPTDLDIKLLVEERYGHTFKLGTTSTGYKDAFGSFGWFGFVKFLLIGSIMGILYRHAMQGELLGQLLYIYLLTKGMQIVSHGTNDILIRVWVYFLILGYPVLYWARIKGGDASEAGMSMPAQEWTEQ